MQLYTIRYATQHIVSKFDEKNRKISEEMTLIEQTLTALPHPTAMQYSKLPNFHIEPYTMERRGASSYKRPEHSPRKTAMPVSKSKAKVKTTAKAPSGVKHAAATGDLAAAISGVE